MVIIVILVISLDIVVRRGIGIILPQVVASSAGGEPSAEVTSFDVVSIHSYNVDGLYQGVSRFSVSFITSRVRIRAFTIRDDERVVLEKFKVVVVHGESSSVVLPKVS